MSLRSERTTLDVTAFRADSNDGDNEPEEGFPHDSTCATATSCLCNDCAAAVCDTEGVDAAVTAFYPVFT